MTLNEKIDSISDELLGEKNHSWRKALSIIWETLRDDYINNPIYRELDLNFDTLFQMKTGLSRAVYEELNQMSINFVCDIVLEKDGDEVNPYLLTGEELERTTKKRQSY